MLVNLHLIIPDHLVSAMKKCRYHVIFESTCNSIISSAKIIFLVNLALLSLVDCADAQLIWSDDFEQNTVGDTAIGWTTKCDTPFVGTWIIADDSTKVYRFEGGCGESFASIYRTPAEYIAQAEVKITSFNSPSPVGEIMAGIQAGANVICYYSALDHFEGPGLYFSDKYCNTPFIGYSEFHLELGKRYIFKAKFEYSQVYFKAWEKGGIEPEGWLIDPENYKVSNYINRGDPSQFGLFSVYADVNYDNVQIFSSLTLVESAEPLAADSSLLLDPEILQNHPNPFNTNTEISFSLPEATHATLIVFNLLGQVVDVLIDSDMEPGHHRILWNGQNLASGVYFYQLVAGDFSETKSMLLLK